MNKFMAHVKKSSTEHIKNTSNLMINDTYSFVFLRSEGLKYFKKHSLGGGNLLMVIGQFAVLSYIAKIYHILQNGDNVYVSEQDIVKFRSDIETVKTENPEAWKLIGKYCKKPMLWEVNETEAFIKLILNYPENIGIPKKENSIRRVWQDFRNKISHISTIANGNMALSFEFQKGETFRGAVKFLEDMKQKSFHILSQKEKDKNRRGIIADNNKRGMPTSSLAIARATYNQICPDLLSRDIQKIVQWLVKKIKNDEFE